MKLEKKNVKQIQWLYQVNRGNNLRIFGLSVINIVQAVLSIYGILVMKAAIDSASAQDESQFIYQAVLFVCLILVQVALQAWTRYLEESMSSRMMNKLRNNCFDYILHGKLKDINQFHSGALMARLTSDCREVSSQILGIFPSAAGSICRLLLCFLVLVQLNPWITVGVVVGGVLFFIGSRIWRNTLKTASRDIQQSDDHLRMFMKESIENIVMIKSFGVEEKMQGEAHEFSEIYRKKRLRRATMSAACNTCFSLVFRIIYIGCFVWCGVEIANNRMSYGTLSAALQLVNQVQTPIANFSNYVPKFYTLLVSAERIREITDMEQELEQIPCQVGDFQGLRCEDVTFGYQADATLRYKPMVIHRGDCLAIKDQSGAGKSTFFKLLLHFYQPAQGSIMAVQLPHGEEVPLSEHTRALFAYVPQDNLVLSGTIAENVGCVDGSQLDMERVRYACDIACATGFIEGLPHQYEQLLGEKGLGLSEGQVQRLAIARAVYANHPILLLDEATSALDETTEHAILTNLKEKTNHTILLISHRKTSIALCDRVLDIVAEEKTAK